MNIIYGYARVSTKGQDIERQLRNISAAFPTAKIYTDKYTGTTIDRPSFNKLLKTVQSGDTIVFDSVSRMSRSSADGWSLYKSLYNAGVNLVFLNEPHINTDTYKEAMENKIALDLDIADADTNECMTSILSALNKYILKLAERQFIMVFDAAETEVKDLRKRTREGIETARRNGKQIGQVEGSKLDISKEAPIKALIRKYSRDLDGNNTDAEVIAILASQTVTVPNKRGKVGEVKEVSAKVSRNTYYKYKREILTEQE